MWKQRSITKCSRTIKQSTRLTLQLWHISIFINKKDNHSLLLLETEGKASKAHIYFYVNNILLYNISIKTYKLLCRFIFIWTEKSISKCYLWVLTPIYIYIHINRKGKGMQQRLVMSVKIISEPFSFILFIFHCLNFLHALTFISYIIRKKVFSF